MKILDIFLRVTMGLAMTAIFMGSNMAMGNEGSEYGKMQVVKLCEGSGITLTASGENATAYLWYKDGKPLQAGDQISIDVFESGMYEVVSVNENNCSSEVSEGIEIIILPAPMLKVLRPVAICEGGSINLSDAIDNYDPHNFHYQILLPSGKMEDAGKLRKLESQGVYQVHATYKEMDCPSEVQVIEVVFPDEALQAYFDYNLSDSYDKGIVLTNDPILFTDYSVGDNLSYEWEFGDGYLSKDKNPVHQYKEKGIYTVRLRVSDGTGCSATMEMQLEVKDTYLIMIPNAFTPMGRDNQTFGPKFRGIASYKMYIYNSWGDLLYEIKTMEDQGWDGHVKGKLAPNGNYVYRADFITTEGQKVKRSGVFLLVH